MREKVKSEKLTCRCVTLFNFIARRKPHINFSLFTFSFSLFFCASCAYADALSNDQPFWQNNANNTPTNSSVATAVQNAPSVILVPNADEVKTINHWFDNATYKDFVEQNRVDPFPIPALNERGTGGLTNDALNVSPSKP